MGTKNDPHALVEIEGMKIPRYLAEAIDRKHDHESTDHNKPIWIVWINRKGWKMGWQIDSLCDSRYSAAYHVMAVLESPGNEVNVERIPANHRFASSLQIDMIKETISTIRGALVEHGYRRDRPGD